MDYQPPYDVENNAWGPPVPPDGQQPQDPEFQQPPQPAGQAPTQQVDFQQYLVQAVVNLGTRVEAFENSSRRTTDVLESIGGRLEDQANANAQFYDKLSAMQTSYAPTSFPSITPSGSSGSSTKADVRMFKGQASEVAGFLDDLDSAWQLMRQLRTDRDKTMFIVTRLADGAPRFWYNYIKITSPMLLDNYQGFIEAFKSRFEDPDLPRKYMLKLEKLTQTSSAALYAHTFVEYLSHVKWTDEHLKIVRFDQGLKPDLQRELLLVERPASLQHWIPRVIEVDNRMHALEASLRDLGKGKSSQSRHHDHRHDRNANATRTVTATTSHAPTSTPAPAVPASNDVVPMEVDAMRRGPLTQQEKDRRRREGLCLYCGQSGHMISKCPNGAKPRTNTTPKAPATPGKA